MKSNKKADKNDLENSGLQNINGRSIHDVISGQFKQLSNLDISIKKSNADALKAKQAAEKAKNTSVGLVWNKDAILELQTVTGEIAKAVQSGVESQELSFSCHTRLAEISRFLFALGVSNIASNRAVVKELKSILKNESNDNLSEIAQNEILTVIKQLKDQEDFLEKQYEIEKTIGEHSVKFKSQKTFNQEIEDQFKNYTEIETKQEEILKEQRIELHTLEESLKEQIDNYNTQNLSIVFLQGKNNELNNKIEDSCMIIQEQKLLMQEQKSEISSLKEDLKTKVSNKLFIVSLVLLFLSLIISFVALLK